VLLLHKTSLTTPLGTGKQQGLFAGAIAVDGVGLFIQGSILILAVMSVLLISERAVEGSPIVAQAAVVVARRATASWCRASASRPRSSRWPCSPSAGC